MTLHLIVGIDPGVTTGLAVWDAALKCLHDVTSTTIVEAMVRVESMHRQGLLRRVVMEDSRLRTWFGTKGREALQGAGSIKRDCQVWTEFAELHQFPLHSIKPAAGSTKWSAAHFKRVTGWAGRTNEHARDAALLILGSKS